VPNHAVVLAAVCHYTQALTTVVMGADDGSRVTHACIEAWLVEGGLLGSPARLES